MRVDARTIEAVGRGALALLVTGTLLAVYLQAVRPWRSVDRELAALREAVAILADTAGDLDRLEAQLARTDQAIAASEALLPGDVALDVFLDQLHDLAAAADVRVEMLTPGGEIEHRLLREMPVDLTLRGGYPAIHDFLARLERSGRLTRVQRLAIHRDDAADACAAELRLGLFYRGEEG